MRTIMTIWLDFYAGQLEEYVQVVVPTPQQHIDKRECEIVESCEP